MSGDDSLLATEDRPPARRHFPILFRWRWWILLLTMVMLYAAAIARRWEFCAGEAAEAAAEEQAWRARGDDLPWNQVMIYQQAAVYYGQRKRAFQLALVFPWVSTPPDVAQDPEAAGFYWKLQQNALPTSTTTGSF